jgi:hypothetical protein
MPVKQLLQCHQPLPHEPGFPDVAAAEEQVFENDYRGKLVEMAIKFKSEIVDRANTPY